MKKALICLSLLAAMALTACGGAKDSIEATPTPLPDDVMNQPATPDGDGEVDILCKTREVEGLTPEGSCT